MLRAIEVNPECENNHFSGVAVWITATSQTTLTFTAGPCNPCTNYTYAEKGGSPIAFPSNQTVITGLNFGTAYSVTVDGTTDYACTGAKKATNYYNSQLCSVSQVLPKRDG